METSTQAIILLQHLPQVGKAGFWRLLEIFETAESIIESPPSILKPHLPKAALDQLLEYQQKREHSVLGQTLERDLAWLQENGIAVVEAGDERYPQLLREIHHPPPLLYIHGQPDCLTLPQLAIVGARNPTPGGRENAFEFARYMAAGGFTITSGLAQGVDGLAHEGALAAGGTTIAVLGTGIDQMYPRLHRHLAERIIEQGGALVSEFPLGTTARASHFPQRNRIISGLSLGVLVVEAALHSGSLITAHYGMHQNRAVFAIPGSIHNPVSRGCHALIRQGAVLVENAQDMMEDLEGLLAYKRQELEQVKVAGQSESAAALSPDDLSGQEQALFACLSFDPAAADVLVARSGMAVGEVMAGLMALELKGLVSHTESGYQRVK